ncbi:unnamed protein product [Caenorhabditis sp. 36 PRJEB53466]|nr:unnamed protein product [Caenorhabditis sp. 36 PRJEB53466]
MLPVSLIIGTLLVICQGCAPTTTVSTPTVNTTTTTTTAATTTTTAAAYVCCSYPVSAIGVNTAIPTALNWNGCNGTITMICNFSIINSTIYGDVAVAGNDNATTLYSVLDTQYLVSTSATGSISALLTCNTTSGLWGTNLTSSSNYYYFTCAYQLSNGTWYRGV